MWLAFCELLTMMMMMMIHRVILQKHQTFLASAQLFLSSAGSAFQTEGSFRKSVRDFVRSKGFSFILMDFLVKTKWILSKLNDIVCSCKCCSFQTHMPACNLKFRLLRARCCKMPVKLLWSHRIWSFWHPFSQTSKNAREIHGFGRMLPYHLTGSKAYPNWLLTYTLLIS